MKKVIIDLKVAILYSSSQNSLIRPFINGICDVNAVAILYSSSQNSLRNSWMTSGQDRGF